MSNGCNRNTKLSEARLMGRNLNAQQRRLVRRVSRKMFRTLIQRTLKDGVDELLGWVKSAELASDSAFSEKL